MARSAQMPSSDPSAAERFSERVDRFSEELRARTAVVQSFGREGADDDVTVCAEIFRSYVNSMPSS